MPTFTFHKDSKETGRVRGANPQALEAKIKELGGVSEGLPGTKVI